MADPPRRDHLALSRRVAVLMDDLFPIPGTRRGVGLDAVIGLVPGVGDLAGSGISGVIMYAAVRSRVPVPVLARMAWNLLVDTALGLVPLVGDVADAAHRSNRRNYRLLEASVEANPDPEPPTLGYLLAAVTVTVLPLLLTIALGIFTLVILVRWVAS